MHQINNHLIRSNIYFLTMEEPKIPEIKESALNDVQQQGDCCEPVLSNDPEFFEI